MSICLARLSGFLFHFKPLSILLMISMLFLSGCGDEQSKSKAAPAPVKVVVTKVRSMPVPQSATFSGTLSAKETVEVRARVSGYLSERLFEEGSVVKAGQVLYKIDDRDLKAALDTAKANTAKAKAAWENADVNRGRFIALAEKGAVSQAQKDLAVAQADETLAAYHAAQAEEEKAEVNLGYATITAPTGGYISRSMVEVGGNVDAGNSTLLTTIYNVDPIRVEFSVTDKQYADFKRALIQQEDGQQENLRFSLALGDNRTPYRHPGRLEMTDPVIDSKTNTLGVRVEFPNPNHNLRPGMYVNVTAAIHDRTALVVPEVAVLDQATSKAVYVVNDQNTLVATPVTVGQLVGENRVITSGLTEGQKVVVEGLVTARPGLIVETEEKTEAAPAAEKPNPESAAPAAGDKTTEPETD